MDPVQSLLARARALEEQGLYADALEAYQGAFTASGESPAIAGDLGRLALRLGQPAAAEQLLRIHLQADPDALDSRLHLATALREQQRYDEAIALLTAAAGAEPQEPGIWTALGLVLVQAGRPDDSLPFFDEAIRLHPESGSAFYHRANALFDLGCHDAALEDYGAALKILPEADHDRVRVPMALSLLATGDLGAGWDLYRARLANRAVRFQIEARPYAFDPGGDLDGRSLLLMAEQGLGDEVMFAGTVPDVLRALGPTGRLTLAVEPRLVPLFARSFPGAAVVPHRTRGEGGVTTRTADLPQPVELWSPIAAPLRRFRRHAADFPPGPYLKPDPARVAHWRSWLAAEPGLKAGILWKSLKLEGERHREFAAFDAWEPVLRAPGVRLVNLQYGDCAPELARAREAFGVDILQPPGIDLKTDLDDVAALSAALDRVIGFSNATLQIAGAVGAPLYLIAGPGAWTRLGTDAYPWYPQARVFEPDAEGWPGALKAVAAAMGEGRTPYRGA